MIIYFRCLTNQDNMPKGGLGNLIALPMQKQAMEKNNSLFIDDNLQPYGDQCRFLATVNKISSDELNTYIENLSIEGDLGKLASSNEEICEPWEYIILLCSFF